MHLSSVLLLWMCISCDDGDGNLPRTLFRVSFGSEEHCAAGLALQAAKSSGPPNAAHLTAEPVPCGKREEQPRLISSCRSHILHVVLPSILEVSLALLFFVESVFMLPWRIFPLSSFRLTTHVSRSAVGLSRGCCVTGRDQFAPKQRLSFFLWLLDFASAIEGHLSLILPCCHELRRSGCGGGQARHDLLKTWLGSASLQSSPVQSPSHLLHISVHVLRFSCRKSSRTCSVVQRSEQLHLPLIFPIPL